MLLKKLLAFRILSIVLYSFPFICILKRVVIPFPAFVHSFFWFEIGYKCDISFFNKRRICNNFFSLYLHPWAPFSSVGSFDFHLSVTIFLISSMHFPYICHFPVSLQLLDFSIVKRWHTFVFNYLLISCGLTLVRFFPTDCSMPYAELWGNCLLLLDSLWVL